jgi:hypothetical protein
MKSTFTNPSFYVAIGTDLIIREIAERALTKIFKKSLAKISVFFSRQTLKLTSRILGSIIVKKGSAALARLGMQGGKKILNSGAMKALIATIKALGKAGAKAGAAVAKIGAKVSAGPIGWALLAFDVLSITLDMTDAGGYEQLNMLDFYIDLKKSIDDEIIAMYAEEGVSYPSVIGPFDQLTEKDLETLIEDQVAIIMADESDPLIAPMITRLNSDLLSGIITEADLENELIINNYTGLIDTDKVYDRANANLCIELGGKIVDTNMCSYMDKDTCENSYSVPLEPEDIYAEYKDGKCVSASYALRMTCEENNLKYDIESGLCEISEDYCMAKGADWGYNAKLGKNDCRTSVGQDVLEFIFGTTVTRGIKQIFDPKQYESCNRDEVDDGYFCRKISCNDNEDLKDSMCYPKCSHGFHPVGCCVCSPNCSDGWTDDGAFCRKAGSCPSNKDHSGALCYDKCTDGYHGVSNVCWERCPAGYIDNGAFCSTGGEAYAKSSRSADKRPCGEGLTDDGTSCWRNSYGRGWGRDANWESCDDGHGGYDVAGTCWKHDYKNSWGAINCNGPQQHPSHVWGVRTGWDDCYTNDFPYVYKALWDRARTCNSDEDQVGVTCYPKCNPGFNGVGPVCWPQDGAGIKTPVWDRQYCNADESLVAGICYKKCNSGYDDDGAFCRKPIHVIAKKSYGRDAGTPDTQIVAKPNTSYGRGVGRSAIAGIRAKKRKIEYSKKN